MKTWFVIPYPWPQYEFSPGPLDMVVAAETAEDAAKTRPWGDVRVFAFEDGEAFESIREYHINVRRLDDD